MHRLRIPLSRLRLPAQLPQRRFIHKLRPLKHDFETRGVGDFLSADAVRLAYTDYQSLALEKLNRLTQATAEDSSHTKNGLQSLVIKTARDPDAAPIFNNASMAHNTEFFFDSLAHKPVEMPKKLKENLTEAFGSIETLRREFVATAMAMFGPGFVWLVRARNPQSAAESFRLLPTYLAGTPYPEAHWRQQRVDMNTANPAVEGSGGAVDGYMARNKSTVGAPGETAPGGLKSVLPVLCLSTWEHVYLPDYGVVSEQGTEGKREYVMNWWEHVDWNVVAERAKLVSGGASSTKL